MKYIQAFPVFHFPHNYQSCMWSVYTLYTLCPEYTFETYEKTIKQIKKASLKFHLPVHTHTHTHHASKSIILNLSKFSVSIIKKIYIYVYVWVLVCTQFRPALCDSVDCSPPGYYCIHSFATSYLHLTLDHQPFTWCYEILFPQHHFWCFPAVGPCFCAHRGICRENVNLWTLG